jgi:hypothetical protein
MAFKGTPVQYRGIIQRCDWQVFVGAAQNNRSTGFMAKVTFSKITDGASKTLLVSEKWIFPSRYETGGGSGDDRGWADGWDCDTLRNAMYPIRPDSEGQPLEPDGGCGHPSNMSFGSAHSGGINTLNADGSVDSVSYGIAPEVFNQYAHRSDGETFTLDR